MTTTGLVNGSFYYFLRLPGPLGLGHMGWGFQRAHHLWMFGALENVGGRPIVTPGGQNDYWLTMGDSVSQMLHEMRTMETAARLTGREDMDGYTYYKEIPVEQPRPAEAEAVARSHRGYSAVFNNCLDNAVNIGEAYGVDAWSWSRHTVAFSPRVFFFSTLWQYGHQGL